jgi:hypothetical protein
VHNVPTTNAPANEKARMACTPKEAFSHGLPSKIKGFARVEPGKIKLPMPISFRLARATSACRAFFGMLAAFAQFETDVRRERQAEGIAKARKAGGYTARG